MNSHRWAGRREHPPAVVHMGLVTDVHVSMRIGMRVVEGVARVMVTSTEMDVPTLSSPGTTK